MNNFKDIVDDAWENKENLSLPRDANLLENLHDVLDALDQGHVRAAEKQLGRWIVHEWIKKAILLFFRLSPTKWVDFPFMPCFDKVPLKCEGWTEADFQKNGFRVVPGSIIRRGAYIAPGVVIMPSFVNIGAYIGRGTMIDTSVRVSSCVQIGENCHISGGVGLGGVLEPLQANPVIIENNCFIGARCQIAEGMIVEEGCVLGMGTTLGASTKIVNRETGEISYGKVPAYSVVVPGSLSTPCGPLQEKASLSLDCAVIVKTVCAEVRSKTEINALLRF